MLNNNPFVGPFATCNCAYFTLFLLTDMLSSAKNPPFRIHQTAIVNDLISLFAELLIAVSLSSVNGLFPYCTSGVGYYV